MRSIGSFCVLMVLGFAVTAHAESFEYRLRQYPASSGDCRDVARDLGARLTQLSGVSLTRAYCADISQDNYDLRFQYTGAFELSLVSTILIGPGAQGGFYKTRDECEMALPGEQTRFEAATGLTAFVAYCQVDTLADRPYAIHIDGFGDPDVRPRIEETDTLGDPIGITTAEFEDQFARRLSDLQVNYSYARYKAFGGFGALSILYYAEERLPLIVGTPVRLQTRMQCIETLADLQPVYEAQNPPPLAVFCAYRDGYRAYDIETISLAQETLHPYTSAEHFPSRTACENVRPALVDTYRNQDGLLVEVSACSYKRETAEWQVVMLVRDP